MAFARAPQILLLLCSQAVLATYVPGSICSGVDVTGPAANMLKGKHLKVFTYEWPGFAKKDSSAPYGWVGLDVDLIVEIAKRMGFTIEMHEMVQQSGETWDAMLQRLTNQGDLVLSYWGRTQDKMNTLTMLQAHIDYSPVLVVLQNPPKKVSLGEKILQFTRPFDWKCWIALIAIIVSSGVVDYLLEREEGGSIGSSIYEYTAGTLWGGFQDPRSTLSAFYQVMLAFILLLVISTYTANLAAFLTVKSIPSAGISSVDELVVAREKACTRTNDPNQAMYNSVLNARLQYTHMDYSKLAGALRSGECSAVITPRINFDAMLTDGINCNLKLAGGSLMYSSAGWLTNTKSSGCVQRPIEMALQQLVSEGIMDNLLFKWLPPGACSATAATRRQLSQGPSQDESLASTNLGLQSPVRRQLKQAGGAGGAATAAEEPDDTGIMYFDDFVGILILWGIATGLIIGTRIAQMAMQKRKARRAELERKKKEASDQELEAAAIKLQATIRQKNVQKRQKNGTLVLDSLFGTTSEGPPNFNSQAAMLRHMVSDLHGVKLMMQHIIKVEGGVANSGVNKAVKESKTGTPADNPMEA